jgi:hypothetical protein
MDRATWSPQRLPLFRLLHLQSSWSWLGCLVAYNPRTLPASAAARGAGADSGQVAARRQVERTEQRHRRTDGWACVRARRGRGRVRPLLPGERCLFSARSVRRDVDQPPRRQRCASVWRFASAVTTLSRGLGVRAHRASWSRPASGVGSVPAGRPRVPAGDLFFYGRPAAASTGTSDGGTFTSGGLVVGRRSETELGLGHPNQPFSSSLRDELAAEANPIRQRHPHP